MKRSKLTPVVAILLAATISFSSCIGSFKLSNKLLSWNHTIGGKFVNEVVFFAFWILPVYEIAILADVLVLNSIEFWSGNNPVADGKIQKVKAENGDQYLVKRTKDGYKVVNTTQKVTVTLRFDEASQTWSAIAGDKETKFMTMLENNKVLIYLPEGETMEVELNAEGIASIQQAVGYNFAAR